MSFGSDVYVNGAVTNTGTWIQRGAISNSVMNSGTMLVLSNNIAARITGSVVNSGSLTFTNAYASGVVTNSGSFSFSGAISNTLRSDPGGSITLNNNSPRSLRRDTASVTDGTFDAQRQDCHEWPDGCQSVNWCAHQRRRGRDLQRRTQ